MVTGRDRPEDRQVLRPSEAQLRWAQFHHRKRAAACRQRVERLWQTPETLSEVPEAFPEDGVTTDESSAGSISVKNRRVKPVISRGRRAMLRVSKRAYDLRRAHLQQHGFQCCHTEENDIDDDDDEEDAVNAMFADEGTRKKHRKRRQTLRRSRGMQLAEDDERLSRFEAAYHAMMMSLTPQERPEMLSSSKRWTRASNVHVAVSIDGRQYDDLKWGFTKKATPAKADGKKTAAIPFDRRASWLIHVPSRKSTSRRYSFAPAVSSSGEPLEPDSHTDEDRELFSPGKLKFDELVAKLQHREMANVELSRPLRTGRRFSGATLRREAQSKREGYARQSRSRGGKPRPDEDCDTEHLETSTIFHHNFSSPHSEQSPDGRYSDFHSEISYGDESEFWRSARNMYDTTPISVDQVHPVYEMNPANEGNVRMLQQRYSVTGLSPPIGSPENASARPWTKNDTISPDSINDDDRITGQQADKARDMRQQTSKSTDSINDDARIIGRQADRSRDMRQQTSKSPDSTNDEDRIIGRQADRSRDMRQQTSKSPDSFNGDDRIIGRQADRSRDMRQQPSKSPDSTNDDARIIGRQADRSRDMRQQTSNDNDRVLGGQTDKGRDMSQQTRQSTRQSMGASKPFALNSIPESIMERLSQEQLSPFSAKHQLNEPEVPTSGFRISATMGGLIQNMFTAKKGAYDDEMRAVAAFRERRELQDDTTSTSSFRLLPDSLRRVVQGFASPKGRGGPGFEGVEDPEPELELLPFTSNSTTVSSLSPSGTSRSGIDDFSPEHGKFFHQRVMQNSALIGDNDTDQTIIDTDDTTSDASGAKMDPRIAANLFLSPTILTKRHQQAIKAIERHSWDQVSYLLSANPWLAEMTDVTTEQYLLHKLALHGGGIAEFDPETGELVHAMVPSAPEQLNVDLIRMFPASVHKFDQDGNLPLHMACVSGNEAMVKLLGERFPSGASVRNNDGLLPLHLALQSSQTHAHDDKSIFSGMIETLLGYFPGAVAVPDNDGNLPIHCAATSLHGDVGVDVVYMLLDEADRQHKSGSGIRYSEHIPKFHSDDDDDSLSVSTDATATPTDSSTVVDDVICCNLVRNDMGRTPLMIAIRSGAGWEVIEAIASGPGGKQAALQRDVNMCNSLHLLVSGEFADAASILSILKIAPQAATVRNGDGMLPIEIACRQMMPREVVLALVLVDLPIDLDEKEGIKVRDGFGASWWFLTCECDDDHVDIVEEVISICSYPQIRELCFMKGGPNHNGSPVISRATPQCRFALRKALRFVGRFEFLGSAALHIDETLGLKVFEALDFGTDDNPFEEGRRVVLRCYSHEDAYLLETAIFQDYEFDPVHVEEAFDFAVQEIDSQSSEITPQQFCVAIERPSLTLDRVVTEMLKNADYRHNPEMRMRYLSKVCMVLRLIAKAIRHVHQMGVVHGNVCLENCGKFDDKWKLLSVLGMQKIGSKLNPSRLGKSFPPEALAMLHDMVDTHSHEDSSRHVTFKAHISADPSFDMWSFGKLCYEVLTGEHLIKFDPNKTTARDNKALLDIINWEEDDLRTVIDNLTDAGVSNLGADLVSHCLMPTAAERPSSMDEILKHPFWRDMRRKTAMSMKSSSRKRR